MTEITVGIPVYNGSETIREAINSVIEGAPDDFVLLVSDNGSTDGTAEIVEHLAKQDQRITLFRQPENLGPVGNFRFLAEQASTPYFAWRAHDDVSNENYFSILKDTLQDNEKAGLAAPRTVTAKTKRQRARPFSVQLSSGDVANDRHFNHIQAGWFYGLYRTEAARAAVTYVDENYPHVWGWDIMMLVYTLLHSGVVGNNQAQFTHRIFGPAKKAYDLSKNELRTLAKDFYSCADGLAESKRLSSASRLSFRLRLIRLILRRVVRLKRMI